MIGSKNSEQLYNSVTNMLNTGISTALELYNAMVQMTIIDKTALVTLKQHSFVSGIAFYCSICCVHQHKKWPCLVTH